MKNFHSDEWYANATTAKVLLEYAKDRKINEPDDQQQETPLMYAVRYAKNLDIIGAMIKLGANTGDRNANGLTPMSIAASQRAEALVVRELVSCGADVNTRDGEFAMSPLMSACQGNIDILVIDELLASQARVDIYSRDKQRTALHYAAMHHMNPLVIERLVEDSLDVEALVNNRDLDGRTALSLACEKSEEPSVITALVTQGASMLKLDAANKSPLDYLKLNTKAKASDPDQHKLLVQAMDSAVSTEDLEEYEAKDKSGGRSGGGGIFISRAPSEGDEGEGEGEESAEATEPSEATGPMGVPAAPPPQPGKLVLKMPSSKPAGPPAGQPASAPPPESAIARDPGSMPPPPPPPASAPPPPPPPPPESAIARDPASMPPAPPPPASAPPPPPGQPQPGQADGQPGIEPAAPAPAKVFAKPALKSVTIGKRAPRVGGLSEGAPAPAAPAPAPAPAAPAPAPAPAPAAPAPAAAAPVAPAPVAPAAPAPAAPAPAPAPAAPAPAPAAPPPPAPAPAPSDQTPAAEEGGDGEDIGDFRRRRRRVF